MSKKDFIRAADMLRALPASPEREARALMFAEFFAASNPRFNRARFLGYIAGLNGPSGGKVR